MTYIFEQYPLDGYPDIVFYLVTVIGAGLIVIKPKWAFLFAVVCLTGKNAFAAVFTRTALFGEYLNLNDLCLWIAVAALVIDVCRQSVKIVIPKILMFLIAIVVFGSVQSLLKYGSEVFVLRSIWAVAIFPIMFLVSVNMVRTNDDARLFYWALFIGAVFATIQHMVYLSHSYSLGITEGAKLRTIAYITNGGLFIIATAIFAKLNEKRHSIFYYCGVVLMAISALMNQTRQLYVVFTLTVITMFFMLRRHINVKSTLIKISFVAITVIMVSSYAFVNLDMSEIIGERVEFLHEREAFESSYLTRWMGIQTEVRLWLDSTIILGVGTAYPPEITEPRRSGGDMDDIWRTGALKHVALSSYLANYGLVGAMVYLLFLPLYTIKAARFMLQKDYFNYAGKIALLAVAVALMDMFNLFGSMLNTSAVLAHTPALIYGAIWGLYIHRNRFGDYDDSVAVS